ncbi:hypothetical protein ABTX81_30670 [Kitasatospora sp. NPDC097605]|uniref:hypothetical protein n=1 Tax=Kitasatospora sp. NPDC097605 TaxID=3157226 RepID=UPI0033189020
MDSLFQLTDAQLWAAIVAFFSPLATSVVQQPTWPKPARTSVAIGTSALIGIGIAYFAGAFTGRGVLSTVLLTVLVSATAYSTVFKPSGIAPALERATSARSRR